MGHLFDLYIDAEWLRENLFRENRIRTPYCQKNRNTPANALIICTRNAVHCNWTQTRFKTYTARSGTDVPTIFERMTLRVPTNLIKYEKYTNTPIRMITDSDNN